MDLRVNSQTGCLGACGPFRYLETEYVVPVTQLYCDNQLIFGLFHPSMGFMRWNLNIPTVILGERTDWGGLNNGIFTFFVN